MSTSCVIYAALGAGKTAKGKGKGEEEEETRRDRHKHIQEARQREGGRLKIATNLAGSLEAYQALHVTGQHLGRLDDLGQVQSFQRKLHRG